MAMSELPPGFVLDQPSALPPGFVLDAGPSLAEDAAKSVGAGLGNAAIGTLGAVGDVRSLLSAGVDAAGSRLGVDPSMLKKAAGFAFPAMNSAPTSQDIRSTVTDPIVSPDYQPQTATGGVLKTGAEFLPAMVGGPESLAAKFATRVAVPALATEAAGSLTKGTAAEPYARVAGALAGGVGASKVANSMAEARALKTATPALADVKSEAASAYDAMTARNVATPLAQSTLDNLAGDITTTLNNRGIRPSNAASIHQAVSEIKTPATAGAADVVDLVAARQSIKELLGKHDTNKSGAFVALGKIEQAIEQNSPGTMKAIREADKNYAAAKAAEALDKRVAKAELRAAGENSGMNVGNKIRQNITTYLGSNEAKYLSAETKADLEKIVRGTASQNTMRAVANLLGGGGGLGMLAGGTAGYQAGGWGGAAAGAAAGRAFKSLNNRSVMKQAEQVGRNIRSRSPLGQQNPPLLLPMTNPLLGGLLPALLARPKQ
jgi:hypothetical protein